MNSLKAHDLKPTESTHPMTAYTISEELFVQAMSYAGKRTHRLVVAVCIFVPLAIYALQGFQKGTLLSVLIVYLILGFHFIVLAPLINRLNYRRAYRNNPLLHQTQHFEIDQDKIRFKSQNGESHYRLAEVKRLVIYPQLVMIYPTTTLFHVIPRDSLSAHEQEILASHVRKN